MADRGDPALRKVFRERLVPSDVFRHAMRELQYGPRLVLRGPYDRVEAFSLGGGGEGDVFAFHVVYRPFPDFSVSIINQIPPDCKGIGQIRAREKDRPRGQSFFCIYSVFPKRFAHRAAWETHSPIAGSDHFSTPHRVISFPSATP